MTGLSINLLSLNLNNQLNNNQPFKSSSLFLIMNCYRCQYKFDQAKFIPKLLVMCGHTLCEKCCLQLHKNGKIQCNQCKTITFTDKVSLLPKNLALISDKNLAKVQCLKHSKKYEAFCSNQQMLICISCILQDGHKTHEMNSISKSYESQYSLLQKRLQKVHHYLKLMKEKGQQNKLIQNQSQKNYQEANQLIKITFDQIRFLIDQQQKNVKDQVQALFKDANQKFVQRDNFCNQKTRETQKIVFQVSKALELNELQFLDNVGKRQENLNLIKFNSFQNLKHTIFLQNKSSIIQNCVKSLNNQKNSVKKDNFNSNASQSSNVPAKTQKNTFSQQPLRGFRKAGFSNVSANINTNCQNNKNPKKVSSRKQPITHHVQTPNLKSIDKDKVLKPNNSNIRSASTNENSNQKKVIRKIDIIESLNTQISSVEAKQSLCHSFMSNMTSFMSQKRSIYILGGFNQENSNILKLDLNSMNYQQVSKLNANRSKFGSIFCQLDKKLYVFGGKRGKQRLSSVESFDIQKQIWKKEGTMSRSRSGFGVVQIQDEIYLIGGNDGQTILNTVQTYNIKTKQWNKMPSMCQSRDQLSVIIGNDEKIYAIGGFGGINNEPLRSVECFDINTKQWKQISKMKYARRALSSATLADGIYAIGGFDGASYMSSVQKFDYSSNTWVQIASMNVARCTHSSIAVYQTQQIYVFGGFDFLPLNSVEKYSLINNQWQNMIQMPVPRFMHSSVIVKNAYY